MLAQGPVTPRHSRAIAVTNRIKTDHPFGQPQMNADARGFSSSISYLPSPIFAPRKSC